MMAFDKPAQLAAEAVAEMLASNCDWKVLFRCRLAKTITFLSHHHALMNNLVMATCGEALHALLYTILKSDAIKLPDLQRAQDLDSDVDQT